MIKFLRMFEKSVIFVVKAGLFLILFATFYGLFSMVAPQLLRPSRTMFITLTTYLLAALLFLRIYGGIPLGIKKSKDIIASVALASFFTDIVAFVELVVMSEFKIIFDFYMLFIVFFIQLLLVIVGTYFGNPVVSADLRRNPAGNQKEQGHYRFSGARLVFYRHRGLC